MDLQENLASPYYQCKHTYLGRYLTLDSRFLFSLHTLKKKKFIEIFVDSMFVCVDSMLDYMVYCKNIFMTLRYEKQRVGSIEDTNNKLSSVELKQILNLHINFVLH
ncbi:hypothetical protein O6H91_01G123300 [Diphasiastrum complanatum]|uniref:Uncharacterized protein n=1 Tax=Diphasiastrum complanatum TaxID=34168 RepID=A0ACC2EVJ8_DIPCM|nr:hypothetical protein O6H91_01G123300 [Diphasiastrum complanatum]